LRLDKEVPCVIWWIASDQLKTAHGASAEKLAESNVIVDAGLGLESKTAA
jgi:hypothetical protein